MNSDYLSREAAIVPAPAVGHGPQLVLMLRELLITANVAGDILGDARNHAHRHLQLACHLTQVGIEEILLRSGQVFVAEQPYVFYSVAKIEQKTVDPWEITVSTGKSVSDE